MAMHDTRVFRDGKQWWVAQILSASGGGWGGAPYTMTHEGAYFREIGSEENIMRQLTIPAGTLNTISHESVLRVLKAAKPFGSAIRITLSNPVHRDEWRSPTITDRDDLEWGFRMTTQPRVDSQGNFGSHPAAEFVCFDDSALKATVLLQDATTLEQLRQVRGNLGILAIIDSIKSRYEDYKPTEDDDL